MFLQQQRMTPLNIIIIFGIGVIFSTIVVSSTTPEYIPASDFLECREKAEVRSEPLRRCISREMSDAEVNETMRMYNDARCIKCKHFCRKQATLISCVQAGSEGLKSISFKSRYMVPFLGRLFETVVTSLCENDGEVMDVINDEDTECFRRGWGECSSYTDFLDDLDRVAFCDAESSEGDPFTLPYLCQRISDFFDCTEKSVETCSPKVISSVATMKSKLSNLEGCTK